MGSDEFIGKKSLQGLINNLIGSSFMHSQCGSPPEHCQERHRKNGEPLCDWCKPGYLKRILKTDEERELIKTCTAKDFNHRLY
jgi:hypothetical protein